MAEEIITNEETSIEVSTEDNKSLELEAEIKKLKAQLSKANTEAAENKRKYQATLSEQERIATEKAEEDAKRDELLSSLLAEKRVATYTSKLLANGYDNDTAIKMANALPDGISDEFFESQKKFLENRFAEIKAEALANNQPTLTAGTPIEKTDEISKEAFDKMGYTEKAKFKQENPDLYEKLK